MPLLSSVPLALPEKVAGPVPAAAYVHVKKCTAPPAIFMKDGEGFESWLSRLPVAMRFGVTVLHCASPWLVTDITTVIVAPAGTLAGNDVIDESSVDEFCARTVTGFGKADTVTKLLASDPSALAWKLIEPCPPTE